MCSCHAPLARGGGAVAMPVGLAVAPAAGADLVAGAGERRRVRLIHALRPRVFDGPCHRTLSVCHRALAPADSCHRTLIALLRDLVEQQFAHSIWLCRFGREAVWDQGGAVEVGSLFEFGADLGW